MNGIFAALARTFADASKAALLAEALKKYQAQRGLTPTGLLEATTLARLTEDYELIEKLNRTNAITLLGLADPYWTDSDGYESVRVDGTWVITNETSARPLQSSQIQCVRRSGTCDETTVFLDTDNGALSTLRTEYKITAWELEGVRTSSAAASCADYIMHIRRAPRKAGEHIPGLVTGHRVVKAGGKDMFGQPCDVLSPHLFLRLDPGFEVQQRYRRELWKALRLPEPQ